MRSKGPMVNPCKCSHRKGSIVLQVIHEIVWSHKVNYSYKALTVKGIIVICVKQPQGTSLSYATSLNKRKKIIVKRF